MDLLDWLNSQDAFTHQVYWKSRDSGASTAGIGCCFAYQGNQHRSVSSIMSSLQKHLLNTEDIRFYGNLSFNDAPLESEDWQGFDRFAFIIPQFEIRTDEQNNHVFHATCRLDDVTDLNEARDALLIEFDKLNFNLSACTPVTQELVSRHDYPDLTNWNSAVGRVLHLIHEQSINKLVLARKSTFEFNAPLSPFSILKTLSLNTPHCFLFHFCYDGERSFLGSSPELLLNIHNQILNTEALAGTRTRGRTPEQDVQFEEELLSSHKDNIEHQLVYNSILDSLSPFSDDIEKASEPTILKLARIQHIHQPVTCKLARKDLFPEVIDALHPTPAVGGLPKTKTKRLISEIEPFERGYYASPTGWISSDAMQFAVAIRSGQVKNNTLSLYSGAGIVEGSNAAFEWSEIESKIENFLNALHQDPNHVG